MGLRGPASIGPGIFLPRLDWARVLTFPTEATMSSAGPHLRRQRGVGFVRSQLSAVPHSSLSGAVGLPASAARELQCGLPLWPCFPVRPRGRVIPRGPLRLARVCTQLSLGVGVLSCASVPGPLAGRWPGFRLGTAPAPDRFPPGSSLPATGPVAEPVGGGCGCQFLQERLAPEHVGSIRAPGRR